MDWLGRTTSHTLAFRDARSDVAVSVEQIGPIWIKKPKSLKFDPYFKSKSEFDIFEPMQDLAESKKETMTESCNMIP
jgi:hypothetical protein